MAIALSFATKVPVQATTSQQKTGLCPGVLMAHLSLSTQRSDLFCL